MAESRAYKSRRRPSAASTPSPSPLPARPTPGQQPLVRVRKKAAPRPSVPWETYPEPLQRLVDIGRRSLGIDNLRPGQAEGLIHIMAGRDLLAVMPTGSGKSLLYQLSSQVLPGLTVVVSPLIALIKDQIDKMVERGVDVCRFDSTLTIRQERETIERLQSPGGKLVLTTPERMSTPEFRELLLTGAGGQGVSLFVVDEAHCVSQWGHDFRPAYLTLRKALEELGRPQVLATTATAPPHVRDDILHQLGMENAKVVTTSFDRPNLHFEVIALPGEDDKLKTLVTLLKKLPKPGVVYCATVKKVEELYEKLARYDIQVARYHGRLTKRERDAQQQFFMDSRDLVMIATNAFGLGVDKANIRYVLHYHVPGSLEAYAQEAGRAGRDKKPARCVLLFSPDDVAIQEYFLTGTYPTRRQVRAVYKALTAWAEHEHALPTVANLAVGSRVGTQRTRTVLSLLKDEGFVVERDDSTFWLADPPPDESTLNDKARQYEARRIADRQRLDALLDYVRAPGCRNQVILGYLGEHDIPACGRCDNCLRSRDAALAAADRATRLEESLTDALNREWGEDAPKPRRVIRHRVIRIDEPPEASETAEASDKTQKPAAAETETPPAVSQAKAPARAHGPGAVTAEEEAVPGTDSSAAAVTPDMAQAGPDSTPSTTAPVSMQEDQPARAPAEVIRRRRSVQPGQMHLPLAGVADDEPLAGSPEDALLAQADQAPQATSEPVGGAEHTAMGGVEAGDISREQSPETAAPAHEAAAGLAAAGSDVAEAQGEYDDDEYDDEYFDDRDYEDGDEDYEDYEDYEDGEGDEELDDEYETDEYSDEEYFEDEDEDEFEDEEDEFEDEDDEYEYEYYEEDEEEIEAIEKTAAALAEEGLDLSDHEITILARKRVPKPVHSGAPEAESNEGEGKRKRKRRRRRRKKRGVLPPKSAFTSPVLSQPTPSKETHTHRGRRGSSRSSGPVIEYVRGPMRINMTPVASATPNDVAPSRSNKKKRRYRRGEDDGFLGGSSFDMSERGGRRRRKRRRRRRRGPGSGVHDEPVSFFSVQRSGGDLPAPPSSASSSASSAPSSSPGELAPGKKRRRRRRRRGRGGRGNRNQNAQQQNANASNSTAQGSVTPDANKPALPAPKPTDTASPSE